MGADKVSIFAYCEMPNSGEKLKVFSTAEPTIYELREQYVSTHQRHFLQRCEYTLCLENKKKEWRFAPYAKVFARGNQM